MRILSNSAKFSAGWPLLTACRFSRTMASTFRAYRFGAVASLNFWRLKICLELRQNCVLSTILDDESLPSLNGSWWNVHTISALGQRWKPTLQKFSLPYLKNMAWEKASNLCHLIEYGRQSETRNFETAQHIDKRLSYVSSAINALQKVAKLRAITPTGFSAT